MKFTFLFILVLFHSATHASGMSVRAFAGSDIIKLDRGDSIIADNLVNMMKLTEKGYVNDEILRKVLSETSRSQHFQPFVPWLKSIQEISQIKATSELLTYCRNYITRRATFSLERVLERLSGNYCRERALEAIGRDIDKHKALAPDASHFIQENMKFFVRKKNKKNFAFFVQSQAQRPEILKKLSLDVINYSVRTGIVPSHEVLKDIVINEQITKLIQDKGFNPLQHQNVFYAEYGKLIESGYRVIDGKNGNPSESKAKEHYRYLKNYLELNEPHLPVGLCLTRLNDFSKAVFRAGHKDLSRDIFRFIIKKNVKEILEDAQFFLLWTWLHTNEFKEALKVAESQGILKAPHTLMDPRLKFWIAFSREQLDQKKEAADIYENIVSSNPLSYYGIMSAKKLQQLRPESSLSRFYIESVRGPSSELSFKTTDLDQDFISSLVRLKAWSKMDNQKMIALEVKRLKKHSTPALLQKIPVGKHAGVRSDLHLINAHLIQESQNYLATFRYVYTVLDKKEVVFNRDLLEVLYPRPYLDQLTRVMKNDALDPLVVLSLIRQESVFNPLARSPVGARGLMQIMPATARRMKRSVRDTHLVKPDVNLELGVKYFRNLMKRYDGNLVYVLAAYNAGESRVERWKNMYFDTDETILKNIESIPFLETRNYVKLIFRNIYFYKLLIEQPSRNIADTGAHNKIFDVNLGFKH